VCLWYVLIEMMAVFVLLLSPSGSLIPGQACTRGVALRSLAAAVTTTTLPPSAQSLPPSVDPPVPTLLPLPRFSSQPSARIPPPVAAFTEEDYEAKPADISAAILPSFTQRDVFLHFHGRGGPDREDADLKARVLSQDRAAGLDRFVHVFVWRDWLEATSTERISFTGQAIGRKLGQALATRTDLRSLHVCGTSAGGFAANECISAYVAAAGPQRATTQLTLCDPFCARANEVGAPWDDGRRTTGARLFGKDADFAEHYVNTDDVVPSTNFPLPRCYCFDVTGSRERSAFPPPSTGNLLQDLSLRLLGYHNWPIGYLARHYETRLGSDGAPVVPSHEVFPRGVVVKVA
jgi:hypothetical protein